MDDAAVERYARAAHDERSRLAARDGDRPAFITATWEKRAPVLKERDRAVAALIAEMAAADERERVQAELSALREALKRHMLPLGDSHGTQLCAGCLEPKPCPDEGLAEGP